MLKAPLQLQNLNAVSENVIFYVEYVFKWTSVKFGLPGRVIHRFELSSPAALNNL